MDGTMHRNLQKEQFSIAYLRAIAAVAGYNVYKPEVDDDSVDLGIGARGGGGTIRSPRIELQLKCTSRNLLKDDHVSYPLEIKNYDELRSVDYQVPRILVVVVVPDDVADWVRQTEEALALHRCGYWMSIRGQPPTNNSETATVRVPRSQILSAEALTQIMNRVADGIQP